jgi:hypothetical protein
VDKAVGLGDGGVFPPGTELMGWDYAIVLNETKETREEEFF